jgi:predicted 2-oxoglutarate/Fe(II)-dependent dioxygenase YbiX
MPETHKTLVSSTLEAEDKLEYDTKLYHQVNRGKGLMTPLEAQMTKVVRIKGFLSEEELQTLKVEVETVQAHGLAGMLERDANEQPTYRRINEEVQKGEMLGVWRTTYLHTNGIFRERLDGLHQKMRAALFDVDKSNWNVLAAIPPERLNFRTVEHHEYTAGGRLVEENHYDAGSFITMDIMLADSGVDFEGGEFITPEADGVMTLHEFQKGDAVFFISHKYHGVQPTTKGKRKVLVAELWDGPEKECAHRCPFSAGECAHCFPPIPVLKCGQLW